MQVIKLHFSPAEAAHCFCVGSQGWECGFVIDLLGNVDVLECSGFVCSWSFLVFPELASLRP